MSASLLRTGIGSGLAVLVVCAALASQDAQERRRWNQPIEPFPLIGNIHYVGAAGVSAFLIVSSEGSILLDGGLPETAPLIASNIAKLGFNISDVKYLLNSHAHFDHAGGLAELKKRSGASMIASAGDAPALRTGGPNQPAVDVDRIIGDGETLRLGEAAMTAVITAGHTKGCTTWTTTATDRGQTYRVVFHCSTSVVDRLVDNTEYPQIVADYEKTFEKLRSLSADVFLGAHPSFFDLERKRERMGGSAANPFVDPAELPRFVAASEKQFREQLANQQKR
jgi:metallo-beta-lactamase class B